MDPICYPPRWIQTMSLMMLKWECCLASILNKRGMEHLSIRNSSTMLFPKARWVTAGCFYYAYCTSFVAFIIEKKMQFQVNALPFLSIVSTSCLKELFATSLWPPSLSSTLSPTLSAMLKTDRWEQVYKRKRESGGSQTFSDALCCAGYWYRCRSAVSDPLHSAGRWQGW